MLLSLKVLVFELFCETLKATEDKINTEICEQALASYSSKQAKSCSQQRKDSARTNREMLSKLLILPFPFFVIKISTNWTGALVWWLKEETHNEKVVSLNPGTIY